MENTRPLVITILCIIAFVGTLFVGIGFAIPSTLQTLERLYGPVFVIISLLMLPIGFVGLIGIWMMRKWGVYTYTVACILNTSYDLISGHPTTIFSYILPIIFIVTGFAYLKRMQ